MYASIEINHAVLDTIEQAGGLPYHIEYTSDEQVSSEVMASHNPIDASCRFACAESLDEAPADPIPFENLVISDLDDASTPQELRSAALRHLQSGKGFFMYGHSPTPESEYHNPNLFPSLYPTLYPYGVGGFDDQRRYPKCSMLALARHLLNMADPRF